MPPLQLRPRMYLGFRFYVDLETTIRQIPSTEQIYLLGDFNVRIGTVQESWHRNIGHFGVSRLYERGHRLLKMCSMYEICITNTFLATKLHTQRIKMFI